MYSELSSTIDKTRADNGVNYLNEALIEKIWQDLDEQVSREEIRQIAAKEAVKFQDATVSRFIPIFIYRQTLEKLKTKPSKIV